MIRPSQAWCIQLDICTVCHLACSNCTRLLNHLPNYIMPVDVFKQAIDSVYTFPRASEPCPKGRRKVVGLIGGEPLLHPDFPELVDYMCQRIPDPRHRGLWTSKDWGTFKGKYGEARPHVERLLGLPPGHDGGGLGATHGSPDKFKYGYLNWNMHLPADGCKHQPLLVSAQSVVKHPDGTVDHKTMWDLIEKCWVQEHWSPTFTKDGFYFCEVAAHFDRNFLKNNAVPFGHECWKGELEFFTNAAGYRQPKIPECRTKAIAADAAAAGNISFAEQVLAHCGKRCGACVPMPGRPDYEDTDDMSQDNYDELVQIGIDNPKQSSKAIRRGMVKVWPADVRYDPAAKDDWTPFKYKKGLPIVDAGAQSVAAPAGYPTPPAPPPPSKPAKPAKPTEVVTRTLKTRDGRIVKRIVRRPQKP